MPQLQNLVLKDRASPAVDHTFTPRAINGTVGEVVESTGVPVGDGRATIGLRRTPTGKYKAELRLAIPVVQTQTINGVSSPVVVRTAFANLDFTFDSTSTEAERNNIVGMMANALDPTKALVNDTVVKLQGVY